MGQGPRHDQDSFGGEGAPADQINRPGHSAHHPPRSSGSFTPGKRASRAALVVYLISGSVHYLHSNRASLFTGFFGDMPLSLYALALLLLIRLAVSPCCVRVGPANQLP